MSATEVVKAPSQKSIRSDLEKLGFPPEIIEESERIFIEEYNMITKRGLRRVKFLYSIVMEAHSNLGKKFAPFELLKHFPRLGKTDVVSASSESFDLRTVTRCVVRIETVNYYLEHFTSFLGIADHLEKIVTYKDNLKLPERMNNYSPNIIALAIISLYAEKISISSFNPKSLIGLDQISETRLEKMKTEIVHPHKVSRENIDHELLSFLEDSQ